MNIKPIKPSENSASFFQNRIWQVEDVAKLTGYSVGTLYNLTSKNLIPHRKKRGKLYFIPVEIQNWIDEGD
jgi:predicted DNA-binding transcriptional regulator AlpA